MEELTQTAVVIAGALLAVLSMAWVLRTAARPSIIERLERSMVSNQTRLDAQEGEIDDLRRQIVELREGRIADHALLQEGITYARRLANLILVWFSESEMRDLASELGIEGHVSGATASEYAGRLVTAARQRGLLLRLVELCRRDRSHGGF